MLFAGNNFGGTTTCQRRGSGVENHNNKSGTQFHLQAISNDVNDTWRIDTEPLDAGNR